MSDKATQSCKADWLLPVPDPEAEKQTVDGELKWLLTLKSYLMLDAVQEEAFDQLTAEACKVFNVPIALVTLVDLGRQFLFSKQGLPADVKETSRSAAYTILNKKNILIVKDARMDTRFKENALVTGPPYLRFIIVSAASASAAIPWRNELEMSLARTRLGFFLAYTRHIHHVSAWRKSNLRRSQFSLPSSTSVYQFEIEKHLLLRRRLTSASRTFEDQKRRTDEMIALLKLDTTSKQRRLIKRDDCTELLSGWIQFNKEAWQRSTRMGTKDKRHGIRGLEASMKARELLYQMERELDEGRSVLAPNIVDYGKVLHIYALSGGRESAAEQAESLLERMLTRCRSYKSGVLRPPEPNCEVFTSVMDCWAKSGSEDSGIRAEEVLDQMEASHRECKSLKYNNGQRQEVYSGCLPDQVSLGSVVNAWSKSRQSDAPERASDILYEAIEKKRDLTTIIFSQVIDAWVQSKRGRKGAEKAEELLNVMVRLNERAVFEGKVAPDTLTFSTVLNGWAQCEDQERTGDAARRAEEILENMIRLYSQGVNTKPNVTCFLAVANAWSKCTNTEAPERAERILDTLLDMYKESNDKDLEPNVSLFSAVISAWTRVPGRQDSVRRAEAAFEKMKSFVQPDLISYGALMNAYAKAGMGRKALQTLVELETKGRNGQPSSLPDVVQYTAVLDAFSRDSEPGSLEHTEALFERMEMLARSGRSDVRPDQYAVSKLFDIYSRSGDPEKTAKAYSIVKQMAENYEQRDFDSKPNAAVLSSLLKVCANTKGNRADKQTALDIAFKTMSFFENSEFERPDHVTYIMLLQAFRRLSDKKADRAQRIKPIVEQCVQRGLLSKRFLAQMERSSITIPKRFDPSWSRNVPERDKPRPNG